MDQRVKPTPHEIRRAREDNPKARERDLAAELGISEAELVAAHSGQGVVRVEPRVNDLLTGLEAVGEVMALTRNESAVHEKIGVYDKVVTGNHNAMVLGENIDLRIFPKVWAHGFAVEKRDGGDIRRSLQFFDASGEAVHKVHLRPASNLYAYQKLVAELESSNQEPIVSVSASASEEEPEVEGQAASIDDLRDRWSRLTDVHQFFGMLKTLKLSRRQAVRMVGQDYAWLLDKDAVAAMFHHAAEGAMPIMCFVGNRGCIQIHSGPIKAVKPMGPWINVLDETFHLHFRNDHIHEVWAVRKPTKDGHVTSLEAYGADGKMIIQFFGKRHEGEGERDDWRFLAENLPRIPSPTAA
ncbi:MULTISPECIES: hemin-degrading factor [unclassified Mesorhizobium]|uniref:hemin-degrading factor n=2 Tax=Mesorhizobium TaxID=68287 RepID=UPI000FCC477E|nr:MULTISPECIES: hemin-degrading factor [unclassified Mesorhizobium]RUW20337.1 hemin-degrading factor [Mesorhizobium sp. M4B.F.Ca.ET.013.02.1.1]RVD19992.1 hemin-degrading factor [Mesorhizobium sp. M4B.F.Ca.ET.017.02.2.1]RWF60446.1 MAG: hemin-degrading factor [Mesorhizobium sp.]TGQ05102.1 hemin-degrading factor [Mesorhizobium sp. M4B.F.Ca.ET.215.01.1.1]TGQ33663.1 hemin-degrading factor [Mesorhizobium sp. M4B.F.Ca.ET.214.01.1.1]